MPDSTSDTVAPVAPAGSSQEYLTIVVGSKNSHFTVNNALIVSRSTFFKTATSKRWADGRPKHITLADDNPDQFRDYLQVLRDNALDPQQHWTFVQTGLIYVLADKLGDSRTTNICIDFIIKDLEIDDAVPGDQFINFVYEHTLPGSKLRKLCVDYYIHEANTVGMDREPERLPARFWHDIVVESHELRNNHGLGYVDDIFRDRVVERDGCTYHQHDETHPTCDGL
ncbi:hypothetical protein LTR86_000167 [Recurvomyces mirabilis]|nr:hypothetical protein LTR86_000167 [Recurvomyces mirabilis]